jgi:hypothetical protein
MKTMNQKPKPVKRKGDRAIDKEIMTLRSALRWGARKELITIMPLAGLWPLYGEEKNTHHCREFMVHNPEDLHTVAKALFSRTADCETPGWQWLFEAYSGLRTEEALNLRVDAGPYEPGWISPDGQSIYVRRAKGQEGVNPLIHIHEGMAAFVNAWKRWKAIRYPESPWYFPGRWRSESIEDLKPLNKKSLTRALHKCGVEEIFGKLISHGARAYYVLVRRSHGIPDPQIAYEIGHTSGGSTLARSYGGAPPHWLTGGGPRLKWLPEGDPAWTSLLEEIGIETSQDYLGEGI